MAELLAMGATAATFALLADAASSAESFLHIFIRVYILVIIVYIIASWIPLPYSPVLNRIQRFLYDVCEPYLRLFRRVLPPLGPLDLSPMVAIVVLILVDQAIGALFAQFS